MLDKFQFIEQFPTVILRNEVTKNLVLDSGKRAKDEILHFVQNDRWKVSGQPLNSNLSISPLLSF